jgi:hypothetical protein
MDRHGQTNAVSESPRASIRRMAWAMLASILLGGGSALLRGQFTGFVHYEAIFSFFVGLPAICLWLILSRRRIPWKRPLLLLLGELSVVSATYVLGWTLAAWRNPLGWSVIDNLLKVIVTFWAISLASAPAVLIVWQYFRPAILPGPYCPNCRYCLIGVSIDCCPECGRAFTLAELGISRDQLLIPKAMSSTVDSLTSDPLTIIPPPVNRSN